ncbi:unnamed protein product, partial [Prorocentrum cordatum]
MDSAAGEEHSISDPISVEQFLRAATRDVASVKHTRLLFDYNIAPDASLGDFDLPVAPRYPLPAYVKVGIIIGESPDGAKHILNMHEFNGEMPHPTAMAQALLSGSGHVPVFRPGPWSVKKAVQARLGRIPGKAVFWAAIEDQSAKRAKTGDEANKGWQPTAGKITEGLRFIEAECPETSGNDQLEWILKSTYLENTPLKGLGKTTLAKTLSMAQGRFNIRTHDREAKQAGFRVGKHLEVFRNRAGEVEIGDICDDPDLMSMDGEEALVFLNAGETGLVTRTRYSPAKFKKNSFRAILGNLLDEDMEPPSSDRASITFDELRNMIGRSFGPVKPQLLMAFLKICVVFIAGQHGFYLRLPGENEDMVIHHFDDARLRRGGGWAKPDHKAEHAVFRGGVRQRSEGHAEAEQSESAIIDSLFSSFSGVPVAE